MDAVTTVSSYGMFVNLLYKPNGQNVTLYLYYHRISRDSNLWLGGESLTALSTVLPISSP